MILIAIYSPFVGPSVSGPTDRLVQNVVDLYAGKGHFDIHETIGHPVIDSFIPGLGLARFVDDPSWGSFTRNILAPSAAAYYGTHLTIYALTGDWMLTPIAEAFGFSNRAITGKAPLGITALPFMIEAAIMAGMTYLVYYSIEELADWYVNDYLGLEDNEEFFEYQ